MSVWKCDMEKSPEVQLMLHNNCRGTSQPERQMRQLRIFIRERCASAGFSRRTAPWRSDRAGCRLLPALPDQRLSRALAMTARLVEPRLPVRWMPSARVLKSMPRALLQEYWRLSVPGTSALQPVPAVGLPTGLRRSCRRKAPRAPRCPASRAWSQCSCPCPIPICACRRSTKGSRSWSPRSAKSTMP